MLLGRRLPCSPDGAGILPFSASFGSQTPPTPPIRTGLIQLECHGRLEACEGPTAPNTGHLEQLPCRQAGTATLGS